MTVSIKSLTATLIVCTFCLSGQVHAYLVTDQKNQKPSSSMFQNTHSISSSEQWLTEFKERAIDNWTPLRAFEKGEEIGITLYVADDGKLYNAEIQQTIGNQSKEFDHQKVADCLQAVLNAACFKAVDAYDQDHGKLLKTLIVFSDRSVPGHTLQLSRSPDEAIVIFGIPLDVLKRYPGVFDEKELVSESNLFSPSTWDEVSEWPREWTKFFNKHPKATKEELIAEATRRGFQYGKDRAK